MKNILLALGIFLSSNSHAQTIDVSQLDTVDKQKHRLAFCGRLALWNENELNRQFEADLIFDILDLLRSNGFHKWSDPVYEKANDDTKASLILGKIKPVQFDYDACVEDLKRILEQNYVPNFSYMKK